MANGGRSIREMLAKDFEVLGNLPCEERAAKLEQIIKLYSNYLKNCRLHRDATAAEIEAIIYGGTLE